MVEGDNQLIIASHPDKMVEGDHADNSLDRVMEAGSTPLRETPFYINMYILYNLIKCHKGQPI